MPGRYYWMGKYQISGIRISHEQEKYVSLQTNRIFYSLLIKINRSKYCGT